MYSSASSSTGETPPAAAPARRATGAGGRTPTAASAERTTGTRAARSAPRPTGERRRLNRRQWAGPSTSAAYMPSSAPVNPTVRNVRASRPTPGRSVQSPHEAGSALGGTSPFHSTTSAASGTSARPSAAPPSARCAAPPGRAAPGATPPARLVPSAGAIRKNAATATSHRNDWRVSTAAPIARQAAANTASDPPRAYASTRSRAISANRIARLSVSSVNEAPNTYGDSTNASVSANAASPPSGVARRSSRSSARAIPYEIATFSSRSFQSSNPTTSPQPAVTRW